MNRKENRAPVLTLLLAAAFALLGCDTSTKDPEPQPPRGAMLVVANQAGGAGNLTTIDLTTGAVRMGAAYVGNTPNDLIIREKRLFVINSISHDMNVIEIMDDRTLVSLDTVDLGAAANRSPQYAAVSDNGYLWISNFTDGTVTVYNLSQQRIDAYLPVGRSPAGVLAVGNKVYVCNSGFNPNDFQFEEGTVSVIDAQTKDIINTIAVGINPQFLARDPRGRLHIVCTGNYGDIPGEINIVNTEVDTVALVVNIGGTPGHLAIASNGRAYCAAGGWPPEENGKVYLYDANTLRILRGPDNPIAVGLGAQRVVIGPDGAAYVACFEDDRVDKLVGEARVESYTGGDGPVPMVVVP